jgi:hypothetical protein
LSSCSTQLHLSTRQLPQQLWGCTMQQHESWLRCVLPQRDVQTSHLSHTISCGHWQRTLRGCCLPCQPHSLPLNSARGSHLPPSPAQVSAAVIELQALLPMARVLYCSATGVSEVGNMAYMARMGLWGPSTSFQSFEVRPPLRPHLHPRPIRLSGRIRLGQQCALCAMLPPPPSGVAVGVAARLPRPACAPASAASKRAPSYCGLLSGHTPCRRRTQTRLHHCFAS